MTTAIQDFDLSRYPSAFGITFTPRVTGIGLGVLGVGAAVFLFISQLQPALQQAEQLKGQVSTKEGEVSAARAKQGEIPIIRAKLEQTKKNKESLLALFAEPTSTDTLLLTLNELVKQRQGMEITQFSPVPLKVIADASFGEGLQGKLQSQDFQVSVKGNFPNTKSLFRSIEQLQPLLVIDNVSIQADKTNAKISVDENGRVTQSSPGTPNLTTSFTLRAVGVVPPPETPPK